MESDALDPWLMQFSPTHLLPLVWYLVMLPVTQVQSIDKGAIIVATDSYRGGFGTDVWAGNTHKQVHTQKKLVKTSWLHCAVRFYINLSSVQHVYQWWTVLMQHVPYPCTMYRTHVPMACTQHVVPILAADLDDIASNLAAISYRSAARIGTTCWVHAIGTWYMGTIHGTWVRYITVRYIWHRGTVHRYIVTWYSGTVHVILWYCDTLIWYMSTSQNIGALRIWNLQLLRIPELYMQYTGHSHWHCTLSTLSTL